MSEVLSPLILCILDGWGLQPDHMTACAGKGQNPIQDVETPIWDGLWSEKPRSVPHYKAALEASGPAVGLPEGQMGNSEVGHTTLGAGRAIFQDLPRINHVTEQKGLSKLPGFVRLVETLKATGGRCHVMGLLSSGGIHSHKDHIFAIVDALIAQDIAVVLHPFLDGRDTLPQSALAFVQEAQRHFKASSMVTWGTLMGRYYAMDRDHRWERTEKAYTAIIHGTADTQTTYENVLGCLEDYFSQGITDEFIPPAVFKEYEGVQQGDGFLMANFRADRVRQVLQAFTDPDFQGFDRGLNPAHLLWSFKGGMTSYGEIVDPFLETLFPPEYPSQTLGEVLSQAGLSQIRLAETEKYAHVTFFLNGGRENPFQGEDRILIPSPKVATYDLSPEMSAGLLTEKVVEAIRNRKHDVIIVNYANTDMVGHTGDYNAACQAVQTVDQCLGSIQAAVQAVQGVWLVTADHGNIEQMKTLDGRAPHTAHTCNLVPFVVEDFRDLPFEELQGKGPFQGTLQDVAPTILSLLGLGVPKEMVGRCHLQKQGLKC